MKRINVSFNEENEAAILDGLRQLLGKESIYSVSDGLNLLVRKIALTEDENHAPESNIEHQKESEQRTQKNVNLTPEIVSALEQSCKRNAWSFSREVRFRLNHTLNDNFDVFDYELREIYITRNAIDKVGRNIRHIILNNQKLVLDKSQFAEDVKEVISLTMGLKKQLDGYIKLCGGRKISNKMREVPLSGIV